MPNNKPKRPNTAADGGTWGRSTADDPAAPELYIYGVRVREADVIESLKDLGDQALADYRSGKLSRQEAYRAAAQWVRSGMEFPQ
jgi:hypothetical protein